MRPISSKSFGQNGILCLFSSGGTLLSGWVKRQIGAKRFIVTDGNVTEVCTLASTTANAASLPAGQCTFVVAPEADANLADEYVEAIGSVKLSTTAGNIYAWRRSAATTSVARLVNNVQYYNIEQGLTHAGPVSGLTIGASFTLTQSGRVRVRLALVDGESEGLAPQFTLQLLSDTETSPGSVLASQVFVDRTTIQFVDRPFLDFTNASAVSLTPGRYWINLVDGPNTGLDTSGAAWFWETNLVDATVKNEFNYSSFPSPTVTANTDNSTGFQMCVEVI